MLQQLLRYLRPNGTSVDETHPAKILLARLDQETWNNWRDLWKSNTVINIITCLRKRPAVAGGFHIGVMEVWVTERKPSRDGVTTENRCYFKL